MPILLIMIVGISIFSMTLSHSDANGVTRTGLQGLKVYLVPNFSGMTLKDFVIVFVDALGQLFFSISVAMGIMVTYGSYVQKETNLMRSINQIEWFDTAVALLAGLMIVPAVYTFMGTEGMSAGPGLMFVSLPKIFEAMGAAGPVIGTIFFLMVSFAAVTSSVSVHITKKTNHSGGITGGISDGCEILFRAAFKPTPSISATQESVTRAGENLDISIKGRHDPIIVPRAVVVVECMAALVILDAMLAGMTSRFDLVQKFFRELY